jgi:hypothetical protein
MVSPCSSGWLWEYSEYGLALSTAHRPWRLPILKCIRLQQLVGTCTTGGGCTTGVRWLLHGCDCHRRTLHFVASAVVCCCTRSSVAAATARSAA